MLTSFMRPLMLIIGFVIASALIEVSINFLTKTYIFAVSDAQVNSMTGLFSIFGYCALYMVLAVALINTSCSVMYILPDAIFQFMGAQTSSLGFGKDLTGNANSAILSGAGVARSTGIGNTTKTKQSNAQMQKRSGGDNGGNGAASTAS